jgi:hypothetical protein
LCTLHDYDVRKPSGISKVAEHVLRARPFRNHWIAWASFNIADGGAFNTGDIAPGAQASFTFQNAGSFPYHCGRHPGMVATINVQ